MASFNKVIMAGNLTRDPQLSYLPSQTPVVEFGLAVNRRWTDRQTNQQHESVCFVDCRSYGRQAEVINQYMRKGGSILIEGRLELDTWEGKDGTRRSKHRIFVEHFTFLGGGQGAGQGAAPPPVAARPPQAPPPQAPPPQAPPPQAPQQQAPPDDYGEPPPPHYDEPQGGDIPF